MVRRFCLRLVCLALRRRYHRHQSQATDQTTRPNRDNSSIASGPAFLFVSIQRSNASHQAAERLARLIRDAGAKADSKLIEGRDHCNANHLLGTPEDRTGQFLLEFNRETTR